MSGLLFPARRRPFARWATTRPRASRASCSTSSCCPKTRRRRTCSPRDYLRARAPFYPRFDHALFEALSRASSSCPRAATSQRCRTASRKSSCSRSGSRARRSSCCSTSRRTGSTFRRRACCGASLPRRCTPERLFVISTHQVRDLGTLMDPIVILHRGRVLLNSTLAEIGARVHMTQQSSPPSGRHAEPARSASRPSAGSGRCGAAAPTGRSISRCCSTRSSRSRTLADSVFATHGRCRVNDQLSLQRLAWVLRNDLLRNYRSWLVMPGTAALVALRSRCSAHYDRNVGNELLLSFSSRVALFGLGHHRDESGIRRPARPCDEHGAPAAAGVGARENVSRLLLMTVGFVVYLARVHDGAVVGARGHQRARVRCAPRALLAARSAPGSILPHFLVVQALFFLGAAWFRKLHYIKTIGTALVIVVRPRAASASRSPGCSAR